MCKTLYLFQSEDAVVHMILTAMSQDEAWKQIAAAMDRASSRSDEAGIGDMYAIKSAWRLVEEIPDNRVLTTVGEVFFEKV